MDAPNFAPRPWQLVGGWRIEAPGVGMIASVRGELGDPMTKAHAAVLTAAPELYEALKRWRLWLDAVPAAHRPPALLADIDAALAKAEGRTNG